MSCYETHIGTLKLVECESIEKFVKDILAKHNIPYYENYDLKDLFYNEKVISKDYVLINDKIYKWIQHNQFDGVNNITHCQKDDDGSIHIFSQFCNGNTCLEERLSKNAMFK